MSPASSPELLEPDAAPASEPALEGTLPSSETVGRRGWLRRIAIVLAILTAAGLAARKIHDNLSGAPATGGRSGADAERAVPVLAVPVQQKEMPIYLSAPGTVTAYYSVTMRTRVDGQLLTVNFREGQSVRKGQLLAQIDPAPYLAALAQAEGQLAKDQAAAVYAKAAAARYKTLYDAGVVSQDREQTETSAAGEAEGAILADKAAIEAAKVNLAFTRILSPIDGVVGLRQVDPGNIVHATDATGLFLVTQLDPIAVIFSLPEDRLPQVQQALRGGKTLEVDAYDHDETALLAKGKLLTLDNQIDTTTGTDKVKAVFDNKDGNLFPNQFVNIRLIMRLVPDALVIPAVAIQTGSVGSFVYVVKRGVPAKASRGAAESGAAGHGHSKKSQTTGASASGGKGSPSEEKYFVEVRPVTVEATEGSDVLVSSGLAPADQVVIDGLEKLKDYSVVAPRQNGPGAGGHRQKSGGSSESQQGPATASQDGKSGNGEHKHQHQGSAP
ncbi:MAG: efflux RND transporter periplasmic adaptor subunit [Terracidiphilus sp.]